MCMCICICKQSSHCSPPPSDAINMTCRSIPYNTTTPDSPISLKQSWLISIPRTRNMTTIVFHNTSSAIAHREPKSTNVLVIQCLGLFTCVTCRRPNRTSRLVLRVPINITPPSALCTVASIHRLSGTRHYK